MDDLGSHDTGPKKDVIRKISPYLVPWTELTEEVKEWDCAFVRRIPENLEKIGLQVYRIEE